MTALRSLQQLQLCWCNLQGISSLLQLTRAPQLTSLRLCGISFTTPKYDSDSTHWDSRNTPATQAVAAVMPGLLQQLPRLSFLEIPGFPLTDAAMQQMGKMQDLQDVHMLHGSRILIAVLSLLPSSVAKLQLQGGIFSDAAATPNLPPQLQQLTALLHLQLCNCEFPPGVLGSVMQLQHLRLAHCNLLPAAVLDELDELEAEGTAALLNVLPRLARLQHLELELQQLGTVSIAPERFSALTASTHLTNLVVHPAHVTPLPLNAVKHMFPAGRHMPLLHTLHISPELELHDEELSCMDSDDLASICRSCPALHQLDISGAVQPGADLSVLAQLPDSCASLLLGGAAFTDAAASVLVQLTHLYYLCWSQSLGFTDAGLEQLTALDLGGLYVYDSGLSDAINPGDPGTLNIQWQDMVEVSPGLAWCVLLFAI
jgi:hypothetical protein